jgi:hypothetical protein
LCRSHSEEEKGRKREREKEEKEERLGHADPKRMAREENELGCAQKNRTGQGSIFFLSAFYYLAKLLKRK